MKGRKKFSPPSRVFFFLLGLIKIAVILVWFHFDAISYKGRVVHLSDDPFDFYSTVVILFIGSLVSFYYCFWGESDEEDP